MSLCSFNSLPSGEYSNLLIVAAFSNSPFSGKTSLSDKSSYLPMFLDEKASFLQFVCVNCIELCFDRFCYQFF